MEPISERLDEVGWARKIEAEDPDNIQNKIFRWMQEATNRIQQLQFEVDKLKEEK